MTDINLPTPESYDAVPSENLETATVLKTDPLKNLPDWVKHPKNFEKIQRALLETLTCGKIHSDPAQQLHCSKCSENMLERRKLMKQFGFKDASMYMEWRKRHEDIKKMMPLDKYNKIISESD